MKECLFNFESSTMCIVSLVSISQNNFKLELSLLIKFTYCILIFSHWSHVWKQQNIAKRNTMPKRLLYFAHCGLPNCKININTIFFHSETIFKTNFAVVWWSLVRGNSFLLQFFNNFITVMETEAEKHSMYERVVKAVAEEGKWGHGGSELNNEFCKDLYSSFCSLF